MSEMDLAKQLGGTLTDLGLDAEQFEALAAGLVWRVGRLSDEGPLTVRIGLATSASRFAELPRLKAASDAELTEAAQAGDIRVEWVGHFPASANVGDG